MIPAVGAACPAYSRYHKPLVLVWHSLTCTCADCLRCDRAASRILLGKHRAVSAIFRNKRRTGITRP
jgi:hypothetical protein